ncbi:MAG: MFS transporter, partial [Halieaceae bacterium]
GGAATLATLTAAAGAGSIIGGLVVSRQTSREASLLRLVTLCLAVGACSMLTVHWLNGVTAFSVLIMGLSMITTIVGTGTQALAQLMVDEDYRGRVLSLWTVLAMGAPAIGALAMGALADVLMFPPVWTGFALVALFAIALLYRKRDWLSPSASVN